MSPDFDLALAAFEEDRPPDDDLVTPPTSIISTNGHTAGEHKPSSWTPIDLTPYLDGTADLTLEQPALFTRSDGIPLLYPGKIHGAHGEPESCKSLAMKVAAAEELKAGNHVVYVDFEDTAAPVIQTLQELLVPADLIGAHFHYIRPDEPLTILNLPDLEQALATSPTLAIVDGVTEAMDVHGLDLRDNTEVARFYRMLPRRLADAGAATVTIDHVTKSTEGRGRFAIGAQHKLAAIDGAAYAFEAIRPFTRGGQGLIRITIVKDRPGYVRPHAAGKVIAMLSLDSASDGTISADLTAPDDHDDAFVPTFLMQKISRALEPHEAAGLNTRAVRGAVKGSSDTKDLALEHLVNGGFVTKTKEGNAYRYSVVHPYRITDSEDDDL